MSKAHKIKTPKPNSRRKVVHLPVDMPAAANLEVEAQIDPVSASATDVFSTYGRDLFERWVLFLETLRQRADNMIEHEKQAMPPLLDFKYETILDARGFDRPANYALLRITQVGDDCWEDCVDETKPPVVVVDPRAGHGPGIGGFKRDSEIGMAMHEGHPVYFVMFYPEPMPQQTLADVHYTLREFVAEVARRHPDTPPVLYGNCQAGWALTLLAADCAGLTGPVVLNGSPLSYWAGEAGSNPMRVMGGLSGGAWAAHLVADLGDGRFDGAWLSQNFESLQPEKAIWEKYANLLSNVDTEADRFLDFERWWNGYYTLSREEILAITQNLFIGNKLESGELRIDEHCKVDLRRIQNPMIVFASYGDNITPPAQALGWVPQVYKDTADLKSAGQRIVYLTNPHVGHLGIFVSASVAKLEHRAILESLDEIEALEPGLYEMKIDNPTGNSDCRKPDYSVRFEPREVSDIGERHDNPTELANVRRASELNEAVYSLLVSPWITAMSNPASAEILKRLHPMRLSRMAFSEQFNPWMKLVHSFAGDIAENRSPLPADDPGIVAERAAIDAIGQQVKSARISRDQATAALFGMIFGGATKSARSVPLGDESENSPRMGV
jgi:pimeloyl-ACP methyl ester carboxylesterase